MAIMPPIPEVAYRERDNKVALELSLLPMFATLANLESFSKTAYAHGVSRSTAFKRIRTLEKITGERLYRARKKRIELTAAGELYAQFAQEVLVAQLRRRRRGRDNVVFASTASLLTHLLAPSIEAFVALDVGKLIIQTGAEDRVVDDLLHERTELAVITRDVEGLICRRMAQVRPVFAARPGHRVVHRNVVLSDSVERERVLCAPELAGELHDPEVVESADVALELAAAGVGVALVEGYHRRHPLLRVATVRDLRPTVLRTATRFREVGNPARRLQALLFEDVRRALGKQKAKTEGFGGS